MTGGPPHNQDAPDRLSPAAADDARGEPHELSEGVPRAATEDEPTGQPDSERFQTEIAAAKTRLESVRSRHGSSPVVDAACFDDWALFLDLDGTLLDIAPTPESVVVPPELITLLSDGARRLDGALAIASGRPIADIDRLLAPLLLPCGGEHGAELRLPGGQIVDTMAVRPPAEWRREAERFCAANPGTAVESKSHTLALHYRGAPERGRALQWLAHGFVAASGGVFELLEADMAWEVRPAGVSKAAIVRRLMAAPPFAGRLPVYIGDDVTDRDGCAAAVALGGVGLMVPEHFPDGPSAVRAWLRQTIDPQARAQGA